MLKAAIKYAELGFSVIPVRPDNIKPFLKSWKPYQTERADIEQLRSWWKKYPSANPAAVTGKISGVTVVDCEEATIEYAEFTRLTVTGKDGSQEQSSYERDRFVTMLERLASDYENGRPYLCSLEMCRPFTLAVNGAFESSRFTHGIDKKYIRRFDKDGETKTVVAGLQNLLQQAYQQGRVLSEMGAPWAVRTEPFDVTDYRVFPSADLK